MGLAIGDRVMIHCPGSQRHGKTGTVQKFKILRSSDGQTLPLADVQVVGEIGLFEAQLGWLHRLPAGSGSDAAPAQALGDRRLQALAKVGDRA